MAAIVRRPGGGGGGGGPGPVSKHAMPAIFGVFGFNSSTTLLLGAIALSFPRHVDYV